MIFCAFMESLGGEAPQRNLTRPAPTATTAQGNIYRNRAERASRMAQTFYAVDRTADISRKHPKLIAWHSKTARDGFVKATPAAQSLTVAEARTLCRLWHGMALDLALSKGLV